MIKILHRTYFSAHHIHAAVHFAKQSGEIERDCRDRPTFNREHRAAVIASVLASVAFLEAAINEVFADAKDRHLSYLDQLDQETLKMLAAYWESDIFRAERYPILLKFQRALPPPP